VVWQVGKPDNTANNKPVLGWVVPDGPAWKAGLRPGDEIKSIDDHPIRLFGSPEEDSLTWRIITSENTNITVKFLREGKEEVVQLTPFKRETKWYERKALRQILISPVEPAIIFKIASNSPAAIAGLQCGDEIVAIDDKKILSFHAVGYAEDQQTNKDAAPVRFTIRRGEEQIERVLAAEKPISPTNMPPSFGILSFQVETNRAGLAHPKPWTQIQASANQIFNTISAVISKKTDIGPQQLGGAVMIIRVYTNLFQDEDGWRLVLWFSVLLNVNLAMLNLLPLPVLDGGHILLSLIEAARRRPVSPRILNYIQSGFAMLLIGFMVWIAFFDAGDWIRSSRKEQAIIFAPKN
jgi:regulator of sigma E protease